MDASTAVEISGLTLAALDFLGLSRWLERLLVSLLDSTRDQVDFLKRYWFLVIPFAFAPTIILYYEQLDVEGIITLIVLVAGGLIGPVIVWFLLHIMNMPPRGIVGSLGLLLAIGSFLLR